MRAKLLVGLLVLLLLVDAPAYPQFLQAKAATPSGLLEMGYSPGTLAPTTTGVPVYTFGDSVWVLSDTQDPLIAQLADPSGAVVVQGVTWQKNPISLYTVLSTDEAGTWTLETLIPGSRVVIQSVQFLVVANVSAPIYMSGESISSYGLFSINYTAEPSVSPGYEFSACAFDSSPPVAVSVPFPTSLGLGKMLVSLNGSHVYFGNVTGSVVTSPFDLWVELHQDYSFTDGSLSSIISRDMDVGATVAVPISPGLSSANSSFTTLMNARPGLFSLRVFFDSSQGLYVYQEPVLITTSIDHWISLEGCVGNIEGSSSFNPSSRTITVSSTLGSNTTFWPRQVYVMYQEDGVAMYSIAPLQVFPAAVDLVAAPWGAAFNDSELTFDPGVGVLNSRSTGGLIFLTASHYPVDVGVSLSSGESQTVIVPSAYTYLEVQVNSSKLTVETMAGSENATDVNLTVWAGNVPISHATASGVATFYLPQGTYNVTAGYDNMTQRADIVTKAGYASLVILRFPGPFDLFNVFATLLEVTAAIGVVVVLFVWAMVYRGRRSLTEADPKTRESG